MVWCLGVWCGMVWCRVVWCLVVWCRVVCCLVVWCRVVSYCIVWYTKHSKEPNYIKSYLSPILNSPFWSLQFRTFPDKTLLYHFRSQMYRTFYNRKHNCDFLAILVYGLFTHEVPSLLTLSTSFRTGLPFLWIPPKSERRRYKYKIKSYFV